MAHRAEIDDTYAEAFRSIYAEVLITARDRIWLDHAVNAVTGNASSSILCDCEAGLDRYLDPAQTPDARPGAVVQFHVPRFHKDRTQRLERVLLVRLSQNVLTCPTAACFNLLDEPTYFKLGRKIAFFGDGWQFRDVRFGRKVWVIPILSGEFVLDRRFGYRDGLMGGNLWLMGAMPTRLCWPPSAPYRRSIKCPACLRHSRAVSRRAVRRWEADTSSRLPAPMKRIARHCATSLAHQSKLPAGVASVQEIIINGRDLPTIAQATQAVISGCVETPGLMKISAGNYGGRLGKGFIYLRPEQQPGS